jgi:hypothetical protein
VKLLSGDKYCTLPLAYPCLKVIKKNVSNESLFDSIVKEQDNNHHDTLDIDLASLKMLQVYIVREFDRRFKDIDVCVMASSLLCPAIASGNHVSASQRSECEGFIVDEMVSFYESDTACQRQVSGGERGNECMDESSAMLNELLWNRGCEEESNSDSSSNLQQAASETIVKLRCINELQAYFTFVKSISKDSMKKDIVP